MRLAHEGKFVILLLLAHHHYPSSSLINSPTTINQTIIFTFFIFNHKHPTPYHHYFQPSIFPATSIKFRPPRSNTHILLSSYIIPSDIYLILHFKTHKYFKTKHNANRQITQFILNKKKKKMIK